jgi:hypothetical protein
LRLAAPAARARPVVALTEELLKPEEGQSITWQVTPDGVRFVDQVVGRGESIEADSVVSLHYTVSLAESGMPLGTSRGRWPLTFAPGRHAVAIFAEGIKGMRVGGVRRLVVPASKIPPSQLRNVPVDQQGESLRFEIELVRLETGVAAALASVLPPGDRRLTVSRALFALSFLPYLLPAELQPAAWHWGDPAAIQAAHEVQSILGGASLEQLGF